jgi:hypothetical protein
MDIHFRWGGRDVTVRPTHRLYRDIESEVSISRLANHLSNAGKTNGADVPMSHVAFVMAQLLRAGGQEADEMQVQRELFQPGNEYGAALNGLLRCFYGIGPEDEQGNAPAPKARKSSRR